MTSATGRLPIVLVAALFLLCGAADPVPPPPPAPEVSADTLFFDDFHEGASRWTFDKEGVWSVRDGALCARLPDQRQLRSIAYAGSEDWHDYAVDLDLFELRGVDKGVVVQVRGTSGLAVDLRGPGYRDVLLYRGEMPLARARAASENGRWHHLRVECRGGSVRVLLDREVVLRHGKAESRGEGGRIALPAYTGGVGECEVCYANVLVTPLR